MGHLLYLIYLKNNNLVHTLKRSISPRVYAVIGGLFDEVMQGIALGQVGTDDPLSKSTHHMMVTLLLLSFLNDSSRVLAGDRDRSFPKVTERTDGSAQKKFLERIQPYLTVAKPYMTAAMAQTLTMFPPYYLVASELLTTDNQQVQSHPIRTGMGLGALVFVARNGLSYILDQLNKCSGNMTDPPPIYSCMLNLILPPRHQIMLRLKFL